MRCPVCKRLRLFHRRGCPDAWFTGSDQRVKRLGEYEDGLAAAYDGRPIPPHATPAFLMGYDSHERALLIEPEEMPVPKRGVR